MSVGRGDILQESRRAEIGSEKNIRFAVVIEVPAAHAAPNERLRDPHACRPAHVSERAVAVITEYQRGLRESLRRIPASDSVLDMTIGDKEIGPAVVVEVGEQEAEGYIGITRL